MKVFNNKLIDIHYKEIAKTSIFFTNKTHKWCILPYPGHPKGCPNYNKNQLCPPSIMNFTGELDKFKFFYLVYAKFDLYNYKKEMLKIHPNWSERQATCVLYWQSSVKKHLKEYIKNIYVKNNKKSIYILSCGSGFQDDTFLQEDVYSMEAVGINVFKTLKKNEILFELKPKNFVLLLNLLCTKARLKL